ncbi:MAG: threonine/serine exporter family protein [Myxococcota bacterium]|jgi:uncharacterized membrane protein YjjP (DUF1212 family)|nr:threonine/serine exporter family protein [Myxococcota bacterium]
MHSHGAPVHRLEATYDHVCAGLGVEGVLLAEPTSLVAIVEVCGEQRLRVARMGPSHFDLGRWAEVEEVAQALACGEISLDDARARVDEVAARASPYPPALALMAQGVVAGTAVGFLGGGWPEVVAAGLIGWLVGLLGLWVSGAPAWSGVFEAMAAFMAGLVAAVVLPLMGSGSVAVATTAGLIGLVPGFMLTVAMTEVATHHLASGTARLAAVAGTFLALGFGVAVGARVGTAWIGAVPLQVCAALPEAWRWAAIVLGGCSFGVLFGASRRDMVWSLVGVLVADLAYGAGHAWLGPEGGACLGALAVGLAANGFARLFNRPAALLEVPGIMVLVPGSVGLRSLTALLSHDVVAGIEVGVEMLITASALVVGVLLANVLIPPRQRL